MTKGQGKGPPDQRSEHSPHARGRAGHKAAPARKPMRPLQQQKRPTQRTRARRPEAGAGTEPNGRPCQRIASTWARISCLAFIQRSRKLR